MPQESPRILGTVQFIEKSAVYNRQNYQWSEYRGIPYAEAERFEYSSQGFSDCQLVHGQINTDIVRSARIKDSSQFPNGEMKNHLENMVQNVFNQMEPDQKTVCS